MSIALMSLLKLPPKRALEFAPRVKAILDDRRQSPWVRLFALEARGQFLKDNQEIQSCLAPYLNSDEDRIRAQAHTVLSRHRPGDERLLAFWLEASSDECDGVRLRAIEALGPILRKRMDDYGTYKEPVGRAGELLGRDALAYRAVARATKDRDKRIRRAAKTVLRRLGL
jgi:HEAT repeat protein